MIYFDYSANYPTKNEVLDAFNKCERDYIGNCNSTHPLGKLSYERYLKANDHIFELLKLDKEKYEIIYTSSASESNNMVIKGLFESYKGYSSNFICSEFEHSSTNAALAYIKDKGAKVELVKTTSDGIIDLNDLNEKCLNKPILMCLNLVESEVGKIQNYQEVASIIHKNNGYLLLDATQGITKFDFDLNCADFISFAPHKFGGIIGIGCLIKRKDLILTPLIHGGKSLSIYRGSTPCLSLIVSTEKAIELALENKESNFHKVKELQEYLLEYLRKQKNILINSFDENPYIVNISYKNIRASKIINYMNSRGICVSQKSACSIANTPSKTINAIYHDKQRALSSFRISLSDLTTLEEVKALIIALEGFENE